MLLDSSGSLNAIGGGSATSGGGGGRVLVDYGSGMFTQKGSVDVTDGAGASFGIGSNGNGSKGVFTSQPFTPPPTAVPEPSSMVLLTIGGLTLAAAHRRRKIRRQ